SGRLRRELGVLPPGDFRNCIVALADAEPLMSRLFQYRFGPGSGLDGHSFGNLFIVAMSGITGNFEEAIRESSRVLAVRGQILPSTLENVTLCAQRGETDGFGVREHLQALLDHLPENPFDYIVANNNFSQDIPLEWRVSAVTPDGLADLPEVGRARLVMADVVDPHTPLRHDPDKLARVLMRALNERSSAVVETVRAPEAVL